MAQRELLIVTRISNFSVQPTEIVVGDKITVTGKLEYQIPLVGWWYPLTGVDVKLLQNNGEVNSQTTDSEGAFSFIHYLGSTGTYLMKVKYPGDILRDPTTSPEIPVKVITQEEKEKENQQLLILAMIGCMTVIIAAAIISR